LESLANAVAMYRNLRAKLYSDSIKLQLSTEKKVMEYFEKIK